MLELNLVYEGDGRLRAASRLDYQLLVDGFEQGQQIVAHIGKRRSVSQLRWFHAMIQQAFSNQRAGPAFDDREQMRAWLLIKAGHCDVRVFEPGAMTREVAAWLRATFRTVDFTASINGIHARTRSCPARPGLTGSHSWLSNGRRGGHMQSETVLMDRAALLRLVDELCRVARERDMLARALANREPVVAMPDEPAVFGAIRVMQSHGVR